MKNGTKPLTLGLIVGNRGFFPDHLCLSGRATMLEVLEREGIKVIALSPEDTPYGSVESLADAQKCAGLFKQSLDAAHLNVFHQGNDDFDLVGTVASDYDFPCSAGVDSATNLLH